MAQHHRRVYTGRSGQGAGTDPTLDNAIEDAYEQAKSGRAEAGLGQEEFELRIVEIRVKGNNPITDYVVDATD